MDKIVLFFCVALSVWCYGDVVIQCGQNEEYRCVYDYPPQKTCDDYNVTYYEYCRDDTEECKNQCVCKDGYYRNYLNECISEANCAKCSKANEFFTCGPACDNDCKDLSDNRTHCSIKNIVCNKKCYCKDGYARNNNGDCVPVSQCNSKLKCNRLNEEKQCVFKCPPERTCDNRFIMFNCLRNETEVCEDKCVCKAGYYRNYLRECISKENCDKCTGDNEFYSCGSACDNKCDNPKYNRKHCNIINKKCNNKCYCKDGYARDASNKCIPVKNCNAPVCNQPNEESVCVFKCPPEKTCDTRNLFYKCAINESEVCQNKCRCKEGYYRNYLNECISEANCEKCSKDHEFFTCGPECDNRCASLDTSNRTNCDIINIQCNEKCYCKDGYARDEFGNCIPVKKCNESCKGPHEVYMKCKRTCPPDTCISLVALFKCSNVTCQTDGCICQENFKRQKPKSPCIPTEQCRL